MSVPPRFLTVDDVIELHAIAVADQGGDSFLRDRALLESAVAVPSQQFGGEYLHPDIPAIAAAYAFHICANHPFLDGNKRAAVAAMIAFLSDNGWRFTATADEAEPVILQLAAGLLGKDTFTAWIRQHIRQKPAMELRDFFSKISIANFYQRFLSLLPAETGANPDEFRLRVEEAAVAMPFLRGLAKEQAEARAAEDQAGADRVTFLAVGMLALHALAEDFGYEW